MTGPSETRAEIARRRLDRLIAEFNAGTGAPRSDAALDSAIDPAPDAVLDAVLDSGRTEERHESTSARASSRSRGRRVAERHAVRVTASHVRAMGVVAVAALVVLGWWVASGRPESVPLEVTAPASMTASPASEPGDLVVDVVGHVRRPGIVQLPVGSRVHDAVEAAGGLTADVERSTINLAREVVDGEQLLVGIEPAQPPAGSSDPTKLNLNSADLAALDELPGVGPVTAQAIIDHRDEVGRFSSVDELLDVSGIGEATVAKLRELVTV